MKFIEFLKLIKTIVKMLLGCITRNRNTLNRDKISAQHVNLEWVDNGNLGDTLGIVITKWMLDKKGIELSKHTKKTSLLMTVGSLAGVGFSDVVMWGSGVHLPYNVYNIYFMRNFRKIDIRAVRGPLTRCMYLGSGYNCPEIYGDPAILMPLIYKNQSCEKKYDVSVIIHYRNKTNFDKFENENLHFIDIETSDYESFIDEIMLSKKVISSTLHGIILAEVYGVPTVFLNSGGYVDTALTKYYDWYLSTNRTDIKIANSLEEALNIKPMELPDIDKMQKNIISSFPYDLWD